VSLRENDRREIARQLFSRPAAAPRPDSGCLLAVCAPDRLVGLCLASAVAGHLGARDGSPWGVKEDGAEAGALPDRAVLMLPSRDGTALRRAALAVAATLVWSGGSPAEATASLRLAFQLREDAGARGPVILLATLRPPEALEPWLGGGGAAGGPSPIWGGVWRPGDPLPAALLARLAALPV
jgi:hypothetical protein